MLPLQWVGLCVAPGLSRSVPVGPGIVPFHALSLSLSGEPPSSSSSRECGTASAPYYGGPPPGRRHLSLSLSLGEPLGMEPAAGLVKQAARRPARACL